MIDVISTKFFPLCFKMAESFENLDNILRDWAKDKVQKKSCRGVEQVREVGRKNTRVVSFGSRVRLNQRQNWSW